MALERGQGAKRDRNSAEATFHEGLRFVLSDGAANS